MEVDYKKIEGLEKIVEDATSGIADGSSVFNNYLAYEFDIKLITDSKLADVSEDAKNWADDTCPDSLHFNHGSYLVGGMKHLTAELNNKPSSNRALLSLISQKDVSDSGDKPIPSFMIFQTSIEDETLYCTTYFRALEISNFLRVNIEEIRQRLLEVHSSCPRFTKIRLVIFSFRAYHDSLMTPLIKPRFDLLSDIEVYVKLSSNPCEFGSLIREKSKNSTVVYLDGLLALKESLEKSDNKPPNVELIINKINISIRNGRKLEDIRLKHSHHDSINQIAENFSNSLIDLAKEFDQLC